MTDCTWFSDRTPGGASMDADSLDPHVVVCATCRQQRIAHTEICRTFEGLAQPSLSPHFNRQLRIRVQAEKERQRAGRWRLLLMQGYWVLASVASAWVLLLLPWPTTLPPTLLVAGLGAILAGALLTSAILLGGLRTGFLDLVLGTMTLLRR